MVEYKNLYSMIIIIIAIVLSVAHYQDVFNKNNKTFKQ